MLDMISLRLMFGLYAWAASCMQLDVGKKVQKMAGGELKVWKLMDFCLKCVDPLDNTSK